MSEEQQSYGYIYRIARADATQLQLLILTYVGAGWTFGGAAQWDFDSKRGRENLRPINMFPNEGALNLQGDFGHAFNRDAEVRWKRRDNGDYDVLVLSEHPRAVEGATLLCVRWWNPKTREWEDKDWEIRRYKNAAIVQTDNRSALGYIDYLAPNGAVQFQRLVEV